MGNVFSIPTNNNFKGGNEKMKKLFRKPLGLLATALVLMAPLMVKNSMSILLWGEPECPECLK